MNDAIGQFLGGALGADAQWVVCYLQDAGSKVQVVSTMPPEQLIAVFERQAAALREGKISRVREHEVDDTPS
jgi:hypothetical protein